MHNYTENVMRQSTDSCLAYSPNVQQTPENRFVEAFKLTNVREETKKREAQESERLSRIDESLNDQDYEQQTNQINRNESPYGT